MIFDPNTKQISFAYYEDEIEDEVDEEKHYLDLVNDVRTMMKRIQRTPNENFPDFLWTPVPNEFDDDYSESIYPYIDMGLGKVQVENGTEIMMSVRKLRNRYKDYFKYLDALETWQRYYDFVEETYGSFDFFASLVENGSTTFPLKLKPKLKNAKNNKHLLEINVPISRINRADGISDAEFAKICSEIPDQIEVYEDYYEYVTYLAQYNKREEERLQKNNRVKGFRKTSSVSNSPEANAILDYLNGGSSVTSKYGATVDRPLSDDIEAFHEYDGLTEDQKWDAMGLRHQVHVDVNYGMLCTDRESKDSIDLFTALNAAGYDVGGMIKDSTMSKQAVKLIKRTIFDSSDDKTSKKAKKMMKKRKKAERKLYEQMASNEKVRDVLTKNRVTFDADDNMFSFTAFDVLNENM